MWVRKAVRVGEAGGAGLVFVVGWVGDVPVGEGEGGEEVEGPGEAGAEGGWVGG